MKNALKLVLQSARDLSTRLLPDRSDKNKYGFAFLVHPRDIRDVYRKYPFLRLLPVTLLEFFLRWYWPVILSHVTGLVSRKTGKPIHGFIFTISLTARQMMENRALALRKIKQAVILAKKSGAKIIGLGGLTSSLSKGGVDLLEAEGINITTGHAYTAYNVAQTLLKLATFFGTDRKTSVLAFVGAAGSIGSTSAQILAREGFEHFVLIDQEHKRHTFEKLSEGIRKLNPNAQITFSHRVSDIRDADFVISTTNAPEAVIQSKDLKRGAIVVDDAQPSDVAQDTLKREDVLVVEAGIVHTPHIKGNFNFNLKDRFDNFCCLAEVLILAAHEWNEHYVLHRATLELVDKVATLGKTMGFRVAEFQNFNESISVKRLETMKKVINERYES
jgi:predicted amino acid dehydrogenase